MFLLFLVTHACSSAAASSLTCRELPAIAEVGRGMATDRNPRESAACCSSSSRAYSLGGGTYTGIEAVSNGLPIMREPRVETGKRTMLLHGELARLHRRRSAALLSALACRARSPGKTINAVLVESVAGGTAGRVAPSFSSTLVSEAALLVVAAQAGFIDGPRVLANMAVDCWVPHRFAALSER